MEGLGFKKMSLRDRIINTIGVISFVVLLAIVFGFFYDIRTQNIEAKRKISTSTSMPGIIPAKPELP